MMGENHFLYEVRGQEAVITGVMESTGELRVPEMLEGWPVTGIEKKAFLSRKQLRSVVLPVTVKQLGDWAFAHCDRLEEITFPHRDVILGKAVFLSCHNLQRLNIEGQGEDLAALLAAAVVQADAPYLLDLQEAGSQEWLAKWDARMLAILEGDDMEGYSKQILCGEEDYGSTDVEAFVREKRKQKVRLLFIRLLHPIGLEEAVQRRLETYLRDHTKGAGSDEAWQILRLEHAEEASYHHLFADLGCITEENFADLLAEVGEDCPQLRAFLLRYKEEMLQSKDFLTGLEL